MDLVSEYAKRVIVLSDGLITFDGTKEELFEKENFKDYHLSEPQTIKILKYLEEETGLKFEEKYTYESLLEYIVEARNE